MTVTAPTLKDLLNEASNLIKRVWLPITALYLLTSVAEYLMPIGGDTLEALEVMAVIYFVLSSLFYSLVQIFAFKLIFEKVGHEGFRLSATVVIFFIVSNLLVGVATGIGMMLLLFPGIVIGVVSFLNGVVLLVEKRGPVDAIMGSIDLMKPYWLKLSLWVLTVILTVIAASFLYAVISIEFFAIPQLMVTALELLTGALISMVMTVAAVSFYLKLSNKLAE